MKGCAVIISLLLTNFLFSQKEFAVSNITASLTSDANAVIRLHEEMYKVKNSSESVKRERLVVTVFNEKGKNEFSCLNLFYNRFIKLSDIEGCVYDAEGSKIESLKKADISDYSSFDDANTVTDNRQKYMCFNKRTYPFPYTIEFSYTEENTNGMFYPRWVPVEHEHTGIEKSVFSVTTPKDLSFRYQELSLSQKVVIINNDKENIYTWLLSNEPPLEFEEYIMQEQLPSVYSAPNDFEVGNYKGNATTWKGVGAFYNLLNQNRDVLPAPTTVVVKNLIGNEKDPLKKIEILYTYMQSKTRYISIQLGIGGWQSMEASEVDRKGYGDCKALSNYMIALLKVAGIKAYPALINAGRNSARTKEEFPAFAFNHVITCIPFSSDTLWLECTSQTESMGYMGSFTGNRKALLITDEGGVLVNTPAYLPTDNSRDRRMEVDVKESGDAHAFLSTEYKGIQQERVTSIMHHLSRDKQKETILADVDIPRCEVLSFSFSQQKRAIPVVKESVEAMFGKLIPKDNPTVFMTPNMISKPLRVPVSAKGDRSNSFYLCPDSYNYSCSDTVVFHFQKTMILKSLPQGVNIASAFGHYTATFMFKDNTLFYCRNLVVNAGTFPSSEYQNWINFTKQVNKSDKLKVVLSQK